MTGVEDLQAENPEDLISDQLATTLVVLPDTLHTILQDHGQVHTLITNLDLPLPREPCLGDLTHTHRDQGVDLAHAITIIRDRLLILQGILQDIEPQLDRHVPIQLPKMRRRATGLAVLLITA